MASKSTVYKYYKEFQGEFSKETIAQYIDDAESAKVAHELLKDMFEQAHAVDFSTDDLVAEFNTAEVMEEDAEEKMTDIDNIVAEYEPKFDIPEELTAEGVNKFREKWGLDHKIGFLLKCSENDPTIDKKTGYCRAGKEYVAECTEKYEPGWMHAWIEDVKAHGGEVTVMYERDREKFEAVKKAQEDREKHARKLIGILVVYSENDPRKCAREFLGKQYLNTAEHGIANRDKAVEKYGGRLVYYFEGDEDIFNELEALQIQWCGYNANWEKVC